MVFQLGCHLSAEGGEVLLYNPRQCSTSFQLVIKTVGWQRLSGRTGDGGFLLFVIFN